MGSAIDLQCHGQIYDDNTDDDNTDDADDDNTDDTDDADEKRIGGRGRY